MVSKPVYFLMKKRLTAEVYQEPPIFPWETEVKDYSNEPSGDLATEKISILKTTGETNQVLTGNTEETPPSSA